MAQHRIHTLLHKLGLTETQAQIFLYLYQFGPKPASSVAKHLGSERTNTYKLIETMIRHGLVTQTTTKGVKHFYISNKQIIRQHIEHQKKQLAAQESLLPELEQELATLDEERLSPLPAMKFFQGTSDFSTLMNDMILTLQSYDYKLIKCFATNTLESQTGSKTFDYYAQPLIDYLNEHHISTELYLGHGILLLEHITKYADNTLLEKLPAGQSSLMIYIIGGVIYLLLFRAQPVGIKIESEELADTISFLFKHLGTTSPVSVE